MSLTARHDRRLSKHPSFRLTGTPRERGARGDPGAIAKNAVLFPPLEAGTGTGGTLPRAPFLNCCVQHPSNWRRARSHPSRAPRRAQSGTPRSGWGTPRWAHPRGAAAGGSLPHPHSLPRRAEPAGSGVRSRGGGAARPSPSRSAVRGLRADRCAPLGGTGPGPRRPPEPAPAAAAQPPRLSPRRPEGSGAPLRCLPAAGARQPALPGASPRGPAGSLAPGRDPGGDGPREPPAARGRFAPSAGAGLTLSPELQGGRPRCKQAAARYINIIYPAVQKPSGRLPFPRRCLPAPPDPADSRSGSPLFTASPG